MIGSRRRKPKIQMFKWLPHHKPVPKGWRLARNVDVTHHHRYGRLIERKP